VKEGRFENVVLTKKKGRDAGDQVLDRARCRHKVNAKKAADAKVSPAATQFRALKVIKGHQVKRF
jgi:hypothetical protein